MRDRSRLITSCPRIQEEPPTQGLGAVRRHRGGDQSQVPGEASHQVRGGGQGEGEADRQGDREEGGGREGDGGGVLRHRQEAPDAPQDHPGMMIIIFLLFIIHPNFKAAIADEDEKKDSEFDESQPTDLPALTQEMEIVIRKSQRSQGQVNHMTHENILSNTFLSRRLFWLTLTRSRSAPQTWRPSPVSTGSMTKS